MSDEPLTDEKLAEIKELTRSFKERSATEPATDVDAMVLTSFVEMASLLIVEVDRLRELVEVVERKLMEVLEKKRDRTVSRLPKRAVALHKARNRSAARRKVKGR